MEQQQPLETKRVRSTPANGISPQARLDTTTVFSAVKDLDQSELRGHLVANRLLTPKAFAI